MRLNKRTLIGVLSGFVTLSSSLALAESSAFTYQGRLTAHAAPATGFYDLEFALYFSAEGGAPVAGPFTATAVPVSNGVFTVMVDFGAAVFGGDACWLQLSVRTNGSVGGYSVMAPRQELTAAPYAIRASTAGVSATAGTASTAASFTGPLSGDVTGTQSGTVVSKVGDYPAASVAQGATAANAATSAGVPGAIMKRDASGNFAAGAADLASVSGSGSGLTNLNYNAITNPPVIPSTNGFVTASVTNGLASIVYVNSATNNLASSAELAAESARAQAAESALSSGLAAEVGRAQAAEATITASVNSETSRAQAAEATLIANLNDEVARATAAESALLEAKAGLTGTNIFSGSNIFSGVVTATNADNTLAGTFLGTLTGNVTGNLSGNADTATSATTAMEANSFTGPLAGDITGAQGATVVSSVGGQTAASIAAGATAANAATSANVASTMVKRDNAGNFAAGTITGDLAGNATSATTANNFSGPLAGDVTGTQGATVVASVGGQAAANIASGVVAANAATDGNIPGTIVKRDGAGNFAAESISAAAVSAGTLAGDGAGVTNLPGANIVPGSVGNAQLAAGAAAANLMASGQSGVPSGGIVFSKEAASPALASAGYVGAGKTVLGVDMWDRRADMPIRRAYHSPVWTGTEMIIWGGYSYNPTYSTYLSYADGARYNPILNTWTMMATNGAPKARHAHTSIWTGSEFIIWGGASVTNSTLAYTAFLGEGARYNPQTDSWAPLSTNGAPSQRAFHTATWTGTEMIVWGGYAYNGGNYVNFSDGARYNPTLDAWAPIATNSLLSGRSIHTAVWTGSKLVIWGGAAAANGPAPIFGDGAVYDPAADSWTPMETNGAPSARTYHTGVWTGNEVIIWGGTISGGSVWLGDGRRYNPETDSWVATTSTAAPSGRYGHVAVWTGTEMLLWGGYGGSYLNTGARYNPSSDSWQGATTTGAPAGRYSPGAIWTGAEMIVTGGENGTYPYFSDAFSYTPPVTLYMYSRP